MLNLYFPMQRKTMDNGSYWNSLTDKSLSVKSILFNWTILFCFYQKNLIKRLFWLVFSRYHFPTIHFKMWIINILPGISPCCIPSPLWSVDKMSLVPGSRTRDINYPLTTLTLLLSPRSDIGDNVSEESGVMLISLMWWTSSSICFNQSEYFLL